MKGEIGTFEKLSEAILKEWPLFIIIKEKP